MMNDKNNPPFPPNRDDPSHIPHFQDWPNVPYADWPRTRFHRWNDSEPANVQPWWQDCCEPYENPCVCVTSADVDLWNSYSGLSGLTAFDPSALSAAFSALDDMYDYSAVREAYYVTSANSAVWNSAAYVPNIYDNLSALYDYANEKADLSAVSAYYDVKGRLKVWTDSEKAASEAGVYGDYGGTIVGAGSFERPLRVSKDLVRAMATVQMATEDFKYPLVNGKVIDGIYDDLSAINKNVARNFSNTVENRKLIEWLLNHQGGSGQGGGGSSAWINEEVTRTESKTEPDKFFYWEEK